MDISAVTQSQFLIQIIFSSSPLSPSENHAPIASNIGDDTGDETGTGADTEKVSSPKEGENRAQNGVGDGNGGSDDTCTTFTGGLIRSPLPGSNRIDVDS